MTDRLGDSAGWVFVDGAGRQISGTRISAST